MNIFRKVAVRAAIPVAGVIVALAGATAAQASTWYGAGSCTAWGQYATCVAGGNAYRPYTIRVRVETHRSQWLRVYWTDVCSKGSGAGSKSGSFSIWAPAWKTVGHNISHPYAYPDNCTVASDAQIHRGNYLHIHNSYTRW